MHCSVALALFCSFGIPFSFSFLMSWVSHKIKKSCAFIFNLRSVDPLSQIHASMPHSTQQLASNHDC
jgi:hypothetical protein